MMNTMANLISAPKINDGGVGGSGSFIDAPSGCLFRFRGVSVMSASRDGLTASWREVTPDSAHKKAHVSMGFLSNSVRSARDYSPLYSKLSNKILYIQLVKNA